LKSIQCDICPHQCMIAEGRAGLCRARENRGGTVICKNYGHITAMAIDPIEKKPLRRFLPGSFILSVGSFGCNLSCPFCQNYEIAGADCPRAGSSFFSPDALLEQALDCPQSIGVAFTYNEPLIGYEYVMDCAQLLKQNGQKVVLVTNGYINEEPLLSLLPFVDAMNIDLKGFTESFYKKLGGSLSPVKRTIELSAQYCHLEVTTLIVPGENDSEDEMRRLSGWLSDVGKEIPLHVSRYFPRHKMTDTPPTPLSTICALADVARASLRYVYEGNC